jgi:hypothetical protein
MTMAMITTAFFDKPFPPYHAQMSSSGFHDTGRVENFYSGISTSHVNGHAA